MAGQDAIAKAGRETFDLIFDRRCEIALGAAGSVTVRPECLLARRRTRRIEEALLRNQNKRSFRIAVLCNFALAQGNFLQRSAEMNRSGTPAYGCAPRYLF